jgi:putative endonuclease
MSKCSDMSGIDAERFAEEFLRRHNLALLQRNYRCRFGEIDLIMRDAATIVFVEVRMRKSLVFGGAAASITPIKQQKLVRTARHFLSSLKTEPRCRFDAVLLSGDDGRKIDWIKDIICEGH